jgi:hypothetical protein
MMPILADERTRKRRDPGPPPPVMERPDSPEHPDSPATRPRAPQPEIVPQRSAPEVKPPLRHATK